VANSDAADHIFEAQLISLWAENVLTTLKAAKEPGKMYKEWFLTYL